MNQKGYDLAKEALDKYKKEWVFIFDKIKKTKKDNERLEILDKEIEKLSLSIKGYEYSKQQNNNTISPDNCNKQAVYDFVDHPKHYQTQNGVEVADLTDDLDFNSGSCIKYVYRAGKKPGADVIQDLEKAIWFLQRRIAFIKGETPKMIR